jgi:hypothetical protein
MAAPLRTLCADNKVTAKSGRVCKGLQWSIRPRKAYAVFGDTPK